MLLHLSVTTKQNRKLCRQEGNESFCSLTFPKCLFCGRQGYGRTAWQTCVYSEQGVGWKKMVVQEKKGEKRLLSVLLWEVGTLYLWKTRQQLTTKNEPDVHILTDNSEKKKCWRKASCKGINSVWCHLCKVRNNILSMYRHRYILVMEILDM